MALLSKGRDKGEGASGRLVRYKAVLVGDAGVGKTSTWVRFKTGRSPSSPPSTIGIDYCSKPMPVTITAASGGSAAQEKVDLQLWDTGGGEVHRGSLSSNYYRDAHAILFVFSVDSEESLQSLTSWLNEANSYTGIGTQFFFLCNKMDIADDDRVVFGSNIMSFLTYHASKFDQLSGDISKRLFYVSATAAENSAIDTALGKIVQILHLGVAPSEMSGASESIRLNRAEPKQGEPGTCPC